MITHWKTNKYQGYGESTLENIQISGTQGYDNAKKKIIRYTGKTHRKIYKYNGYRDGILKNIHISGIEAQHYVKCLVFCLATNENLPPPSSLISLKLIKRG